MSKHLHHDAIVAWAGGARIQNRPVKKEIKADNIWKDCIHMPEWLIDYEYRVKPPEPKYPTTRMTPEETMKAVMGRTVPSEMRHAIANAALRHACDAGQVVPREDFDRALADCEARHALIANAALVEAASIVESMGAGLSVTLTDMLACAAEKVRGTSVTAIVRKAVA